MKRTNIRLFIIAMMTLGFSQGFSQSASGQNLTFSPYSNFGLGEWLGTNMVQNGSNLHTRSSAYSYTMANPATLGNLYFTTFDFGGSFKSSTIMAGDQTQTYRGGGMNYFNLAFRTYNYYHRIPYFDSVAMQKRIKTTRYGINSAISLQPLTSVGYKYAISDSTPFISKTTHSGYGGVNMFELANGFRLGSHVHLGYSIGRVFGQINDQTIFSIPDSTNLNVLEDLKSVLVKGTQQKFGFLVDFKLDSTYHSFGGSYQMYSGMMGEQTRFTRTMELFGSFVSVVDTITNLTSPKKSFQLPNSFGLGYQFKYRQAWTVALDYRQQNWQKIDVIYFDAERKYNVRKDYGVTFTLHPNDLRVQGRRKMQWPVRVGAVYSETQYAFNTTSGNVPLIQQRAFVGFGIPIVRRYYDNSSLTSLVHVQLDYVQRGTTNHGLAQEKFFNVTLGLQLGDMWFQRRKFD
jgi:hypothetical protein